MAVRVKTRTGKTATLLNPAEKGRKYAAELGAGVRITNDGKDIKTDKNGNIMYLSDTQAAYRSGYLDARKDSAKCHKARKRKKK